MKVCQYCFNDFELKRFIVSESEEKGKCDYCSEGFNTELLEVGELLDFFSEFIGVFKIDTSEAGLPLVKIIQKDWNLFVDEQIAHDILSDLLLAFPCIINNPQDYVSYTDEIVESYSYWNILKDELKWNLRFLIDVDRLVDLGWDSFFNKSVEISNDYPLFRARVHLNGEKHPFDLKELGCPPRESTKAGRANPTGIPYLYLSKEIETTLYETRATFLDDVSIGIFKVKEGEKIVVVDFTEDISAFLNIGNIVNFTKSRFLKEQISRDLSKPMRRSDSELEYIPTQFICEFIRYITGAEGILFASSLYDKGKNLVLFSQEKVICESVELHRVKKVEIESEKY